MGKRGYLLTTYLVLMVALGCGGGGNALDPKFQPQVANNPDNFQFQTTGVKNVTQTLTYQWQNTGTAASINQACSVSGGSAFISLRDANNNMVYSADLKANGTFTSIVGTAGTWTIQVVLSNVTGTLNFRAQKM